jgi:murein DD-endopeptidase MepM/ murein hydrolase activator NlpD
MSRRLMVGAALMALSATACAPQSTVTPLPPEGTIAPMPSEGVNRAPSDPLTTLLPGAPVLPTPLQFTFPTAGPNPLSAWRPPPYPVPWSLRPEDHFYFMRPIPSGQVNWPLASYRYGNIYFAEGAVHTGVDLDAADGTPVLAAGPGKVVWVGFGLSRFQTDPSDPYGLAISIRHDFGYNGQVLYTVYAHLQKANVWVGQRVKAGEEIGLVGRTGNADGPHLHFEVRLGQDGYFTTRNPELWMVPPEGWGVLAGRILDTLGRPLQNQLVHIRSLLSDQHWEVWTYAGTSVNPDDAYGENFVISDLPSGPYEVRIDYAGHAYTMQLALRPGETNLVAFRGRQGFTAQPTSTPGPSGPPPYP